MLWQALALVLAQADGGVADAGAPLDGAVLFQTRGCSACHTLDGGVGTGPSLRGLFGSTVRLQGGARVVADEAYVRESILKSGAKVVEGYLPLMPLFKDLLRPAEVDALVEYLRSQSPPTAPSTQGTGTP